MAGCVLVGSYGGGEGFTSLAASGSAVSMQSRPRPPSSHGFCAVGRNNCRFPLGQSVEHSLFSKRNVEVRVAADFSDSKPESFKRRGKWGYHPLEDLSKLEKDEMEHAGDGKLTNAEVARTVSELNWTAVIIGSVSSGDDAAFGTEIQYLVDDRGDLYFEVDNDHDFLFNLTTNQVHTVYVGFGNVDIFELAGFPALEAEYSEDSDSEDDSSDEGGGDSDIEIYWERSEDLEGIEPLSMGESWGSLGGWGGSESLASVHPMDFASKVSEAVSAGYLSDIDKPPRRLTITGVVRRVTENEEAYVKSVWFDRFLLAGDEVEEKKTEIEAEIQIQDGDDVGLVVQNVSDKVKDDGGSKLLIETANLSDEEDIESRSELFGASELSSHDRSVIELPSSSVSMSEDIDLVRDERREGSDAHEGGIASWEFGTRKNRSKKRGSLLDNSDAKDEALEVEEASEVILPPGATLEGDAVVGEWTERARTSEAGTSFYKLEIMGILLDSGAGVQSNIEVRDFAYAEPDILAHFSSTIMERVNTGGKKMETALKAVCQRTTGLEVEEASLFGVDCLGVDLRVRCGIEVQTVRVPFHRRATCEDTACKLLDQLLFPRIGQRRPKKRGQQWNSQ